MAKMKLYYSARFTLRSQGPGGGDGDQARPQDEDVVNVVVSPIVPNADVDMHNPIGKIPALAVKGLNLFDSPVIFEYLDSQHKGRKLLPRKGRERWVALRLQAMADGLLDAAILTRYEGALRPKDKRWPDWVKGQTKKIEGVLAQLEAEAKSLKGKPTIGTISVACALGYLDYRFAAMDWRATHRQVVQFYCQDAGHGGHPATGGLEPGQRDHHPGTPGSKGSYPGIAGGVERTRSDPHQEPQSGLVRTPQRTEQPGVSIDHATLAARSTWPPCWPFGADLSAPPRCAKNGSPARDLEQCRGEGPPPICARPRAVSEMEGRASRRKSGRDTTVTKSRHDVGFRSACQASLGQPC